MGLNENVNRNVVKSRLRPRIKQKMLDRRGRIRRFPPDVAAAVGKQVMKVQARSLDELYQGARKTTDEAMADLYLAVKKRDAARVEAVQALWSNPQLALDREFLVGALKLMHPAEIRPFVRDVDAESF